MADPVAEGGHGAGAEDVGMPQLDFDTFPSQIFWLVVALVVLYFILSRVALPRIASAIEERHDAIEDDLDRAAEFKRRAKEAERAYEDALARAKAKAQEIAAAARAEAQADLEEAIARADGEIAARTADSEARIREIRDGAMASIEQVAGEVGVALVARFAPDAADETRLRAAVAQRLQG